MKGVLVLVHTVAPLLAVFDRLVSEMLPGVQTKHILDEPLLELVKESGTLEGDHLKRLQGHIDVAEAIEANSVLVTCSSISQLVKGLRPVANLPVFTIDEAMVEAAVKMGTNIGVLATNASTLGPTRRLLNEKAVSTGKTIKIETKLVKGAFDALMAGDGDTHDQLLLEAIKKMDLEMDVVVLAQASMARVLDKPPDFLRSKPILSSPRMAIEKLKPLFS